MKYFILMITTFILLMFSSPSFSSFIIKLKTGQKFVTKSCWEENGEIKFYRYGGVVGVRQGLVDQIREVQGEPETVAENKGKPGPEEKKSTSSPEDAAKKEAPQEKKPTLQPPDKPVPDKGETATGEADLAPYRQAYLDLKPQYEETRKIYWKARRAKDNDEKERALEEMKSLERQLTDLKQQVKEKNNGALPEWWK